MAIDQRDVSSTLRFMDDRALQQYAAMHKNDPYIFPLAFQESQNRQRLRMSQQTAQGMQPQPKVNEQALAQMAPQPMPEMQGIGALPAGNMQQMADGGIAGYDDDANFAQRSEPVVMMAEGGVARYQVGGTIQSRYQQESQEMVSGNRVQYSPDVAAYAQQLSAEESAARNAAENTYLKNEQQRMLRGPNATSAASSTPAVKVAPTYSPDDYSGMDRRIMSGSQLPSIQSITPPTKPAPKTDAAPKADTTRRNITDPSAARKNPAAEKDKEPVGIDALVAKLTRETDLAQGSLRNQRVGLASQLEQEALGTKEEGEKRRKERGDVFAGKEARLAEREKGVAGLGDKYMGLALLQAGAAMMSTPGSIGMALGKGIQVGSERYIAGIDKINAAKDKFAEARDRLDELRLNRDDMNDKEIKEENSAIRRARIQGQQLLTEGATKDLEISNANFREFFRAGADDLKTDKTIKAERDNVLTRERGANARAAMPTGADRTAMMLGTGKTPAERLESGMKKLQEITADKSGMAAVKVLADINAKRQPGEPTVTMQDLLIGAREFSSLMYGPKVADVAPTRDRPR
jgi:hypothetical protein